MRHLSKINIEKHMFEFKQYQYIWKKFQYAANEWALQIRISLS